MRKESDGKSINVKTSSNAANIKVCFLLILTFQKYTANAKELIIEFDTKINTDRWYIGLSDLAQRPGESSRGSYDEVQELFSHKGTKDGKYYYINSDLT